jgi:hypothetical protein
MFSGRLGTRGCSPLPIQLSLSLKAGGEKPRQQHANVECRSLIIAIAETLHQDRKAQRSAANGTEGKMSVSRLTQDQMNTLAQDCATKLRVARQPLPTVPGQSYVDSVPGHRVLRGPTLSVQPNQHLQPLQISRHFSLLKEQNSDSGAVQTLIAVAAADIAQAEDAVILLGSQAGPFLEKLHVKHQRGELERQEGLFHSNQKEVGQSILDSILVHRFRETDQLWTILSAPPYMVG